MFSAFWALVIVVVLVVVLVIALYRTPAPVVERASLVNLRVSDVQMGWERAGLAKTTVVDNEQLFYTVLRATHGWQLHPLSAWYKNLENKVEEIFDASLSTSNNSTTGGSPDAAAPLNILQTLFWARVLTVTRGVAFNTTTATTPTVFTPAIRSSAVDWLFDALKSSPTATSVTGTELAEFLDGMGIVPSSGTTATVASGLVNLILRPGSGTSFTKAQLKAYLADNITWP